MTPGGSSSPRFNLFILSSKMYFMASTCSVSLPRMDSISLSAFSSAGIISFHLFCGMVFKTSSVMGLPLASSTLPFLSAILTCDFLLRRSFLTLV